MRATRMRRFALLSFAGILVLATLAQAQDFPTRFIRIIVGPGPDIVARLLGPKITEALGQEVVVEPRPGAGGVIAAQTVATAPADGYTLLMASASYTIGTALGTMPQDLRKDYAPVALGATAPFVLVVHPSVAARTVGELIELAKASPGRLNYASSGIGTPPHLAGELLKTTAGIDMVHVPFRDANAALNAVVAGSVQMAFAIASVAQSQIAAGSVRGLAVTSLAASPLAPGLPTIAEAGLPGYEVLGWNGFVLPRGTPEAIVNKLNAALERGLEDPDLRRRLEAAGYDPAPPNGPAAFAAFIAKDTQKWLDLVAKARIKLN